MHVRLVRVRVGMGLAFDGLLVFVAVVEVGVVVFVIVAERLVSVAVRMALKEHEGK